MKTIHQLYREFLAANARYNAAEALHRKDPTLAHKMAMVEAEAVRDSAATCYHLARRGAGEAYRAAYGLAASPPTRTVAW